MSYYSSIPIIFVALTHHRDRLGAVSIVSESVPSRSFSSLAYFASNTSAFRKHVLVPFHHQFMKLSSTSYWRILRNYKSRPHMRWWPVSTPYSTTASQARGYRRDRGIIFRIAKRNGDIQGLLAVLSQTSIRRYVRWLIIELRVSFLGAQWGYTIPPVRIAADFEPGPAIVRKRTATFTDCCLEVDTGVPKSLA
ncbi:hypothetical protein BU26DRAFT_510436 [Trematosphaeria pertusa]|uniref:Uncharacterized protein n=1 Tax=Trematosphaeria pertusa TaxID=390896 RepID=A0A6A6HWM0_9PLEO|nr:uncharacterized protein BU26DRAFT_510436 [Trematosphaeria pertusa]KAF2242595.1 hypothetical protein BU26DRAFT_510436 [Trematosphaeria pertusa]